MKNIKIIFFLFVCLTSNAQSYEFDLLSKYDNKQTNYEYESIVYSNSKNQNYFLLIKGDSLTKSGILYDLLNNRSHNFDILESKMKNELYFDFKYVNSKSINRNKTFNSYELVYSKVNSDSLIVEIKIDFFKNSKRKKSERTIIIKGKRNNNNLFPLFRFSSLHPLELNQNINLQENLLIESAKEITSNDKEKSSNLLFLKEVKFEIQVPVNN